MLDSNQENGADPEKGYSWGKFWFDVFNVAIVVVIGYLVLKKLGVIK